MYRDLDYKELGLLYLDQGQCKHFEQSYALESQPAQLLELLLIHHESLNCIMPF